MFALFFVFLLELDIRSAFFYFFVSFGMCRLSLPAFSVWSYCFAEICNCNYAMDMQKLHGLHSVHGSSGTTIYANRYFKVLSHRSLFAYSRPFSLSLAIRGWQTRNGSPHNGVTSTRAKKKKLNRKIKWCQPQNHRALFKEPEKYPCIIGLTYIAYVIHP